MTINTNKEDGKFTLALEGRLDTLTAPHLQEQLVPVFADEKDVYLDFTDLAYISSAGLRVLLIGEKAAKAADAKMTVVNVPSYIMEVLEMTGFSDILTVQE